MSRLEGKTALVTGATGGISGAIAKRFVEEGANVLLVGRSAEKLAAARGRLGGSGQVGQSVVDATDEAAMAKAVATAVDLFGGLDIVVANAGMEGVTNPVEAQSLQDFEAVLRTNVVGVWLTLKYGVEPLKSRGGGSMIALSSAAGLVGFPAMSPYVASKHAVYGLVKTAALELGEAKIRVNAIGPGPIDNRMMKSVAEQLAPGEAPAMRSGIEQLVALKRYGTNEEVANLALFLASDESSYCTRGMYMVDGGFTAA